MTRSRVRGQSPVVTICSCLLLALPVVATAQRSGPDKVKDEIKEMYRSHIQALKDLDHGRLMSHYADVEDHVLFGDGAYWGGYGEVDRIWGRFISDTRQILTWDISEQHIHLLSGTSASFLVEYYLHRTLANGADAKTKGSVAYGLKKLAGEWKIITTNVTHIPVQ